MSESFRYKKKKVVTKVQIVNILHIITSIEQFGLEPGSSFKKFVEIININSTT